MLISLPANIETARVPELPEHDLVPALDDYIMIWVAEANKTRKVPISSLRQVMLPTGGSSSYVPVYKGGTIIYEVPPEKEGDDWVDIPQLAGKNFTIIRDMMPLLPGTEYEALSTGGFRLVGGTGTLIAKQRFLLTVFELQDGTIPGGGLSGGSYINGKIVVNTNYNVVVTDSGIIHQIRGGSNSLTLTLPDVDLVPVNSTFTFEAIISNDKQHKITTSSDQYIYLNNESVDHIWIGKGEKFVLFRDDDGWYVHDGRENYMGLARPKAAYKPDINEVIFRGQELARADYPRLWEFVQGITGGLVTDEVWNTPSVTVEGRTVLNPYRGCFSTGNGTTTFRVPNLLNVALRGLKNIGGSDPGRHHNGVGGFQMQDTEGHFHFTVVNEILTDDRHPEDFGRDMKPTNSIIKKYDKTSGQGKESATLAGSTSTPTLGKTSSFGGSETRMDNIGVIWVGKY